MLDGILKKGERTMSEDFYAYTGIAIFTVLPLLGFVAMYYADKDKKF